MTTYLLVQFHGEGYQTKAIHLPQPIGQAGYAIRCPWHQESTPSCAMSPRLKRWHCFSCEAHGTFEEIEDIHD